MQGEIYTEEPFGTAGLLTESYEKLINERPEYFVFNGHVASLTEHYPLRANVGETVRLFFGVGGPNFTSSFHVIGEIFDRAYQLGSVTSPPVTDVQSISVPPGSANIVEFKLEVPGRFVLVDHALSRAERGLAGYLIVEGPETRTSSTLRPTKTLRTLDKEARAVVVALAWTRPGGDRDSLAAQFGWKAPKRGDFRRPARNQPRHRRPRRWQTPLS